MSILHVSTCQVHVWPRSLSITEPKLLLESILRPTLLSNISDMGCPFEHHCLSLCFSRSSQVFSSVARQLPSSLWFCQLFPVTCLRKMGHRMAAVKTGWHDSIAVGDHLRGFIKQGSLVPLYDQASWAHDMPITSVPVHPVLHCPSILSKS